MIVANPGCQSLVCDLLLWHFLGAIAWSVTCDCGTFLAAIACTVFCDCGTFLAAIAWSKVACHCDIFPAAITWSVTCDCGIFLAGIDGLCSVIMACSWLP